MEKFFKLKENGTTVSKEIVAGITTFLAMAYILAVNPGMLSAVGNGMTFPAVFTATAISSAIATLVMALWANLPVALAPGMGLNAFFTFTVCLGMGCSWQLALTAVLIEGIIFIVLSIFGIREKIINAIPAGMKKAVAVGIGLFIALIGLANAGIVSGDTGTIIGFVNFDMKHTTALVAMIGLIITIVLYLLKVPGAILIAILATTIIGIPFGVTTVPEGWVPFSLPASPLLFKFDFAGILSIKFVVIVFTFLFTDLFDTVGTLMGVTQQAGLVDEKGNIPSAKAALMSDSIGTVVGACLGTSTVTSYVESSSGVAAGGRTGLTSLVAAILFGLSLLLSPIFLAIPSFATAPALIIVGFLMLTSVTKIDFNDMTEAIPAFIAIIAMPFLYSISEGISMGVISYVIINVVTGKAKEKKISVLMYVLAVLFILKYIFI